MATSAPELDLDKIIRALLAASPQQLSKGPVNADLTEKDIYGLCARARALFLHQDPLFKIEAPVTIVGDIHAQYTDLLRLFELGGAPSKTNQYLFLGDYVDRGTQSIETICLLLAYKIKFPYEFHLLRGNHEGSAINRLYGFYDECIRRFTIKVWRVFCDCFNCLPIAAIVSESIFCVHGGLSPDLKSLDQIRSIRRPTEVGDTGLLCDLVWSDPKARGVGFVQSDRGVSFNFGADECEKFLQQHNLDLICRAHQVVEDGYEFFANRKLVTVFSAPNYCGTFDNAGALMIVGPELKCSFKILQPQNKQ